MSDLTLVRIWRGGFRTELPNALVEWRDGTFTIHTDDIAAQFDRWREHGQLLTVWSTDELIWVVDRVEADFELRAVRVSCKPYATVVRLSLISDDYLFSAWLEAEKKHREESR